MTEFIRRSPSERRHEDAAYQSRSPQWDPNSGIRKSVRKARWPEIFTSKYDPDELAPSGLPPDHVRRACAEVIGPEPKYKVRLHPWFKRLAFFERVSNPSDGGTYYRCISVFQEEPEAGALPSDLDGDPRYEHLRGRIGAFRLPTKRDFELIVQYGDKRRGIPALMAEHDRVDEAELKEWERESADWDEEFLDYHHLYAETEANGGCKPYSVPTVELKKDPARYAVDERVASDGTRFIVRARRGTRFAEEIEREKQEREAAEAARFEAHLDQVEAEAARRHQRYLAKQAVTPPTGRTL